MSLYLARKRHQQQRDLVKRIVAGKATKLEVMALADDVLQRLRDAQAQVDEHLAALVEVQLVHDPQGYCVELIARLPILEIEYARRGDHEPLRNILQRELSLGVARLLELVPRSGG